MDTCSSCGGAGAKQETKACTGCGGSGRSSDGGNCFSCNGGGTRVVTLLFVFLFIFTQESVLADENRKAKMRKWATLEACAAEANTALAYTGGMRAVSPLPEEDVRYVRDLRNELRRRALSYGISAGFSAEYVKNSMDKSFTRSMDFSKKLEQQMRNEHGVKFAVTTQYNILLKQVKECVIRINKW